MVCAELLKYGQSELICEMSLLEQFELYAALENVFHPVEYITYTEAQPAASSTKHVEPRYFLKDNVR